MSLVNLHLVVVTYNRSSLLRQVLSNLTLLPKEVSAIHICNNSSSDDTEEVVVDFIKKDSRIKLHNFKENLGGAGGFARGMQIAMNSGASWIGLMDDDLLMHPKAIEKLNQFSNQFKIMALCRENLQGQLSEYAAIKYDLSNPFRINPKVRSVQTLYKSIDKCPEVIEIDCASFEGFFIERSVVEKIGLPYAEYFIYGDDFDYCIRLRRAGERIVCIRDAIGTRMLPYQKNKFNSWKTYYIWRNFFVLHMLYGRNLFVRVKPYILTLGLLCLEIINRHKVESFRILSDAVAITRILHKKLSGSLTTNKK